MLSFRVKHVDEDRRTRFGTVLVWTGLERLPRLFSVLSGQMSLVGPRANTPDFLEELHRRWPAGVSRVGDVQPGLFGYASRSGSGQRVADFFTRLADRLYVDRVYCDQLARCTGLDVLGLDLSVMVRSVIPGAAGSAWPAVVGRSRPVRIEYPAQFSAVALKPEDLAARLPAGREAHAESADHGLTVTWLGDARPAVVWPALDETVLEESCDEVLLVDGLVRVAFRLDRSEAQGNDLIRIEMPLRTGGLGEACEQLAPVWEALASRSTDPGFADRVQVALLEGMSLAASRAGPEAERLQVLAEVEPSRLSPQFEVLPVSRTSEAVRPTHAASAG